MHLTVGVLAVSLSALAQVSDLATNYDGSELYFGSRLIHQESSTEPHSKIFRWTRETGIQTFLVRKKEWTTPMPRNGIATNYYDLRYPFVSYDGRLSFSGYRDCQCPSLTPTGTTEATVLNRDGTVALRIEAGNGPLLPFRAPLSPNGKFILFNRSYEIDSTEISFESSIGASSRGVQSRITISDDGAIVFGLSSYQMGEIGRVQANGQRSNRALLRPASVVPVVPIVSGNGKVAVYESRYEPSVPRRFFSLDLETGQETRLFSDAETEDYGTPDFFVNSLVDISLVPTPDPMYGASIDYSGRNALVLAREAVDRPRQWLYLARTTDLPAGQGEWFAYTEEGYREAVLSGDARVVFAVTNTGRLIRINRGHRAGRRGDADGLGVTNSGSRARGDRGRDASEELLPRTPFVESILGSARPGALVRLYGGGFATETILPEAYPAATSLAGVEVALQGKPMVITRVSPTEIDFQIPWEFQFQPEDLFEYPLVVKAPGSSPLILAPLQWQFGSSAKVLPPGPVREDGTPVTLGRRARSFEVLRMVVSGVPQPPGVTGVPTPDRVPVDYACRLTGASGLPVETLYAGPLPNTIGLSEVVLRLPDLTGFPLTFNAWTTIACGGDTGWLFHGIPVEKD